MAARATDTGANWPISSNSSDNEKGNETDQSRPDDTCPTPTPTPPPFEFDDPKGWVAVVAAACSLFCYLGVIYSWGIMQVRLVEVTGTSLTTLTFVGSLATSFMISLSILSGLAVRKIGYQKTALAGGILMGLGEFLASWTTKHVGALFVFHGVIFGIGGGLSIFACSTAPLRWFKRHRGLAMGIVFGGGSLGAAIMSIATNLLVQQVDVAWTFRILGFMLWAVCIPASYFIQQPSGAASAGLKLQWYRFRERRFLLIIAGTALSTFPLFIPPYFIPIFSRSMGYSNQIAIVILAAWNLASTVGRVLGGYTADHLLGPINSLIVCLLFIGLSSLVVWPLASTVGIFSVFLVFNGIGCGAYFSLVPPMLGATMGPENTLGILPIVWTTWFCGFFFGTPIASGIYSLAGAHGNEDVSVFRPAAYYAGAMSLVGLLFIISVRLSISKKMLICI
ncbi:major facilitator superfamily domain-containing protein [Fusarium flagelliforme]|uniref:major facilitator superfamily domain-containing protein n=1 Tax=Fusarium flagelliforme TaxID=2675880 RepID=UPI001E8DF9F4|nr:major facilitator superfamily domain-containing protein [Fusarium flagelliforme]KAH7184525.1 major facilitator superfamily domain-containing protein [Fusarium flagelliforme]